jgi:hypothetical protein
MNPIYAATTQIPTVGGITNVGAFVNTIVNNAIAFAGVIAFIFIIIGGFGILSGAGDSDPKKIEQGKQTLTYAIVGLLIVVFSLWFMQALRIFLGFDPLAPDGI